MKYSGLISILAMVLTLFFCATAFVSYAQNPFTTKPEARKQQISAPIKPNAFTDIVRWQQKLKEKMTDLIREAESEKKTGPVLLLALFAFLYGAIHSAGPGHGKAISLSYILSCKPSLLQGIAFGNIAALTHGLSGILFVLSVKFILETGINRSLETMTYITQIISFFLISLIGLAIVVKSLVTIFKKPDEHQKEDEVRIKASPFLTAFAVGLVPCPGVVMVMLFSISMGFTGLGIFLGSFIALGMAFTITLIILLGMSGKAAILKASGPGLGNRLAPVIETLAGIMVAALGIMCLLANF